MERRCIGLGRPPNSSPHVEVGMKPLLSSCQRAYVEKGRVNTNWERFHCVTDLYKMRGQFYPYGAVEIIDIYDCRF